MEQIAQTYEIISGKERSMGTGSCHSFLKRSNSTFCLNYKKDMDDKMPYFVERLKEMGFNATVTKDSITIKTGKNTGQGSAHNVFNLFLYQIFRALLSQSVFREDVYKLAMKYDKMKFWDIIYLASQNLADDKKANVGWYTYFDPFHMEYFHYVSLNQIKEHLAHPNNQILSTWPINIINRRTFNKRKIINKNLECQMKFTEIRTEKFRSYEYNQTVTKKIIKLGIRYGTYIKAFESEDKIIVSELKQGKITKIPKKILK